MKPPKTILLVDRDAALADALADQFRLSREFRLETADSIDGALARLAQPGIDLVLAETEAIGELTIAVPTLAIAKPLRLARLLAAIREAVRQQETQAETSVPVGPHQFFPHAKLLVGPDQTRIRLTEKESAILNYLSEMRGEIVDRATLLAEIWGYGAGITTHTLETHVYRLRRKIGAGSIDRHWLVREAGGYRLVS